MGDQFRLGLADASEFFAQGFGDVPMQDLLRLQQAFIGRFDERVLEAVARFGGVVAKHDLKISQLRQRASQRGLVAPDHGVQQRVREFAGDRDLNRAISFTARRRSRRAISGCSVEGIAKGGNGPSRR